MTRLLATSVAEVDAAVEGAARRTVVERYRDEGGLGLGVYACEDASYLVDAPGHGRYHVAPDGSEVRCAVDGLAPEYWQRALLGQVMPLAATLAGMELIHASAAALGGRAYAFSGRSGAGKSSICAHLVGLGATPLTDDVLALEASDTGLTAHAGPRRANVFDYELASMSATRRTRLGPAVAELDKVQLDLPVAADTPPLGALYLLERHEGVERFEIEELDPPDPVLLLATAFIPHVTGPERLRNQLEVCAQLATRTRVRRLRIPLGEPAPQVACRVAEQALADEVGA